MPTRNKPWPAGTHTALVTGASAGIGAEFARQLAVTGMDLVLVARRRQRLEALAAELTDKHGVTVTVMACDLANPDTPRLLDSKLRDQQIHIDYLVNNAGYGVPGKFGTPAWETHEDFMRVMVTCIVELTYLLLPAMQARGWGRIINVSSMAGLLPGSGGHTLYAASKAFLVRFTESLYMENQGTDVNVVALCPGFTYSEFHDVTGTRDLVSKLPKRMWSETADVVRVTIESLERKNPVPVVIPGWYYRWIAILTRVIPTRLQLYIMRRRAKDFRNTG